MVEKIQDEKKKKCRVCVFTCNPSCCKPPSARLRGLVQHVKPRPIAQNLYGASWGEIDTVQSHANLRSHHSADSVISRCIIFPPTLYVMTTTPQDFATDGRHGGMSVRTLCQKADSCPGSQGPPAAQPTRVIAISNSDAPPRPILPPSFFFFGRRRHCRL